MDENTIIAYIAAIFFLFMMGRIFVGPLKKILKLIVNSILGGVLIFIINLVGSFLGFHIGLNLITAFFVRLTWLARCNCVNCT